MGATDLGMLSFEPLHKTVVWGGREFGRLFGRRLPDNSSVGESWEIVDLPEEQSVVSAGAHAGRTLGELRRDRGGELLGPVQPLEGRFPLLLKFLDARRKLSVQVHPDERACALLGGGARPKTEAWYVIERDPGAALYVGLREGVDRAAMEAALSSGTVEELLSRVPVEPGDFFFLPAGTVHAIGAGIVLAEVQQSSDTTYRVFDWNRVGLDGRPRRLHVAEALTATDYRRVGPQGGAKPASGRPGVACPFFSMELIGEHEPAGYLDHAGPMALMGVSGPGSRTVEVNGETMDITAGRTVLVPASAAKSVTFQAGDLALLAIRAA